MLRVKVIYLDIGFYMWYSSKRNIKSKRKKEQIIDGKSKEIRTNSWGIQNQRSC